jgi:uncharacterized BrkB/YihY/UPF0761 family membrane protein
MISVQSFLETEGGKIAVIIFILLWLSIIAVYMVVSGHPPQETGKVLLSNAFTSFVTLLLAKLGDKKAQGPSA